MRLLGYNICTPFNRLYEFDDMFGSDGKYLLLRHINLVMDEI